jgi:hypothetical protein
MHLRQFVATVGSKILPATAIAFALASPAHADYVTITELSSTRLDVSMSFGGYDFSGVVTGANDGWSLLSNGGGFDEGRYARQ